MFKKNKLLFILSLTLNFSIAQAADPFELVKRFNLSGLKALIEKSPELAKATNAHQETLLIVAAHVGDTKIIAYLLKKNDINQKDKTGHTALYYAISNAQEKAALALIAAKADLQIKYDANQDSILHVAAQSGNIKIGEELIVKLPELLNQTNANGETPVFEAVKSSQSKFARFLIEAGAKKDLKNKKNQAVLDLIDPKVDKKMYRIFRTHEE